ncbi:ExbD/TolR family protein [Acuticoccus yangtzensis]|uniref:ExbD/TolR family protein n=1 Tax=Acuticoccus yangtzensis TaxID=1443441 RepID=UPI000A63925E|nr:biopolymer transporter ExbD [Acuticoccus yangtzensis]
MIAAPVRKRRRLPLTPLIDVIFLLLLFFMLSSTFLRFADVEVAAAAGASPRAAAPAGDTALLKLRFDGTLALGPRTVALADLAAELSALPGDGIARLILTADRGASVQALVEVLEVVEAGALPVILAAPPEETP